MQVLLLRKERGHREPKMAEKYRSKNMELWTVGSLRDVKKALSSAVFVAFFSTVKVRAQVLADQEARSNLSTSKALQENIIAPPNVRVNECLLPIQAKECQKT